MDDLRCHTAGAEEIERLWQEFTGLPIVTMRRSYTADDACWADAIVCTDTAGRLLGHVSWDVGGETEPGEIVTIEAKERGRHIGGRLIDAAEEGMRRRGVKRVVVTTTNDNLRAQAFYQRRGYRLIRIELDGMERVRALKPGIPETGNDGLPLRDMWEFEKEIRE